MMTVLYEHGEGLFLIPFFSVKSAYRRRRDQMKAKPTARHMVGRDLVTHTGTFPNTRERDGGN